MTDGLIGRKVGMTRVFLDGGTSVPVTVIEAGPCRVLQVRGSGVQLGFISRTGHRVGVGTANVVQLFDALAP